MNYLNYLSKRKKKEWQSIGHISVWLRRFSVVLIGLLFVFNPNLSLAASAKFGGTIHIATNNNPDTLDVYSTSTDIVRTMHYHTHEQLYVYNEKFDVIPQLAESHTVSPDGRLWTFKLRKGVLFHNLKELTAEDVVASWKRWMNVSNASLEYKPKEGRGIKEVRSVGKDTVVFEFLANPGPFINKLSKPRALFFIYPKEISEKASDRKLKVEEMIGSGPFKLTEWKRGESVTMTRFNEYKPDNRYDGPRGYGGNRTAYVDKVVWNIVSESGAQEAGLRAGRYHVADGVPSEMKDSIEADPNLTGVIIKPLDWLNMMVNHHNPPMDNPKVRRAVQIALDQSLIMLAAIGNSDLIRLDPGLCFKEQVWHNEEGAEYYNVNDPEKAKMLLQEAGYKGEEIVLMTNTTIDNMFKSAPVVQQQLKAIGMNVRLEVMDWAAELGHITNKKLWPKWHLASMSHGTRFDPTGWYRNFYCDEWTPYCSADMDKWLDTLAEKRDFNERYEAFKNVQRIFHTDVVNIKHGDYFGWHALSKKVKDYSEWEGYNFWNVWLED